MYLSEEILRRAVYWWHRVDLREDVVLLLQSTVPTIPLFIVLSLHYDESRVGACSA